MKKAVVGAVSAVLLFAMGMSIVACNVNGKNKGAKVAADSEWYESEIYKINLGIDTSKEVEQTFSWIAGADDENMVIVTKGRYMMPDSITTVEEANPYVIATVSVVDRKNNTTVRTINLNDEISVMDDMTGADYNDGKLTIKISGYDEKTYSVKTSEKDLDIASGKVTDTRELTSGSEVPVDKSFKLGGYTVDTMMLWNQTGSSVMLAVYSPDGNMNKVELKEHSADIYEVPLILPLNEKTALITAITNVGSKFFELDLENAKVKDADSAEYEWINADDLRNTKNIDGATYFSTPLGIYKIDMEKKATEMVLDFSRCGINRTLLSSLEITDCKDGSYVLCGKKDYGNRYDANKYAAEFYIVKLSKAAKNPHAGKTILELYAPYGHLDETVNDAILKFNETNGNCFIEVTNKYTPNTSTEFMTVDSSDEYDNVMLNQKAEMSNRLAMDIMNGEGPDIIMNTGNLGQLNNDSYLIDLAPYFNDLDKEKYFTNLLEAAKKDGKLYQMPVCYTIDGICTDKKNAGASGVGFTTEEYGKFVSTVLNGQEAITSGQAYYFAELFSCMSDKFIKEGKADFSGTDFKVLADYVKENVPEKAPSYSSENYPETNNKGSYIHCYAISGYFYGLAEYKGDDLTILGLPSADGRGPAFQAYTSAGVSSQAPDKDACIEFIKLILSDEIQENLAMQENYVLNREAFRKGGKAAVEFYNGPAGDISFGYDMQTGAKLQNRIKFSEKDIDNLESIILSVSGAWSQDQSVNLILIEEMPAYFTGQKSLEDVVKIAQDRVQKVLDERK